MKVRLDETSHKVKDICLVYGGMAAVTQVANRTNTHLVDRYVNCNQAVDQAHGIEFGGKQKIPNNSCIITRLRNSSVLE